MNDLDDRLLAALQADAPPARDARFRVEVLMRHERARFKRRVRLAVVLGAAAAVLLMIGVPVLNAWIAGDLRRLSIVAAVPAAVLFASALAMRGSVAAYVRGLAGWTPYFHEE